MQFAAILFALAALGGLTMVGIRLNGTPRPPTWLAIGHGAMAALGLLRLIYAALTETLPTIAMVSLGVFVLAAVGGATIFVLFHLRDKPLPIPLMLAHAGAAVSALILLLLGILV